MYQLGDKLRNGAIVIDATDEFVLAGWPGTYMKYVTWRLDEFGNTYWGHYFHTPKEAVDDFIKRAEIEVLTS